MQLSSMVHGSGRYEHREAHELHYYHNNNRYVHTKTRAHQPQPRGASALVPNPYSGPQPYDCTSYQQHPPRSPPSPPVEEAVKPSLPSISSLLGIANGGERGSQEAATNVQQQLPHSHQHQQQQAAIALQVSEHRPDQASQAFTSTTVSNPTMTLPPTPPMRPDSVIDGNQSPSTISSQSVSAPPYYLGGALNNVEPHQQRQVVPVEPSLRRQSIPSQPSLSPYTASPYATSPYGSSPGAASSTSFYSPENRVFTSAGIYQQRPLPTNFPPPPVPVSVPASTTNAANPWQHHHYISASSQAAFPQSPDRYICQTCNKAFSRPSSLRIHSHSHTGEKPFKCPHTGCGKAFSVRSNMKRHERGCHASGNAAASAA